MLQQRFSDTMGMRFNNTWQSEIKKIEKKAVNLQSKRSKKGKEKLAETWEAFFKRFVGLLPVGKGKL